MKIGILTIHCADNYGSVLQSYGTQEMLSALGHDVVILDYTCSSIKNEYGISRIIAQRGIIKKIEAAIRVSCLRMARKNFSLFRKQYYKIAPFDRTNQKDFDFYLVGSDQVWNYEITGFDKTYLLDFVHDNTKKISYSSSFGLSKIERKLQPEYAALLGDFAWISVREWDGTKIVKELTGRQVPVVLDPVFMIPRNRWEMVSNRPAASGYILLYYIAYSPSLMNFVQRMAKKQNKKIISIQGSLRHRIDARYIWNAGPSEYLGLIQNADCVVTNSFHGTAFAIVFHKKFYVELLPSFEKTNSRLENVLQLFHLEKREIKNGESVDDNDIDYAQVEKILAEHQDRSLDYLRKAIGNGPNHEA